MDRFPDDGALWADDEKVVGMIFDFFLFFFDLKVVIVPKQIEEGVTLIQHWPIHVNS